MAERRLEIPGIVIIEDSEGALLSEMSLGGRTMYAGRPGTIFHELAYLASMPEETQCPNLDHDPASEQNLQRQFREVILPWYRGLTQQSDGNP